MNSTYFTRTLQGLFALLVLSMTASAQGIQPGDAMPLSGKSLEDVQGERRSLASVTGDAGLVVLFWANSCPWIDRYEDRVKDLISAYRGRGVGFVLVNSNDMVAFPSESPEQLREQASKSGYGVPYLSDADAAVARAFGAQRAPEVFVFNGENRLVYTGAIDDSPAVASQVSTPHLKNALDALLGGNAVSSATTNAIGCTIKFP